jgi:hypothetical protein
VGELEPSDLRIQGARVRRLFPSEQLAFDQRRRQGCQATFTNVRWARALRA